MLSAEIDEESGRQTVRLYLGLITQAAHDWTTGGVLQIRDTLAFRYYDFEWLPALGFIPHFFCSLFRECLNGMRRICNFIASRLAILSVWLVRGEGSGTSDLVDRVGGANERLWLVLIWFGGFELRSTLVLGF